MKPMPPPSWRLANQRSLVAAIAAVRARIAGQDDSGLQATMREEIAPPQALERLGEAFGLSSFERTALLACAGLELDPGFAELCAATHPGGLCFALLFTICEDAHWDAISPAGPLRRWRLIELADGPTLATSALRLDERVLHHLTGAGYLDPRLHGSAAIGEPAAPLPPSQHAVAERIAALWAARGPAPLIHLSGGDSWTRRSVCALAAALCGCGVLRLSAAGLPSSPAELFALARLIEREALLEGYAIIVECDDDAPASRLIERLTAPVMICEPRRSGQALRSVVSFEIDRPLRDEQRDCWTANLSGADSDLVEPLDRILAQFSLSSEEIRTMSRRALADDSRPMAAAVWQACREQTRGRLHGLARRVETPAGWDGLVLPQAQIAALRDLATQMRLRSQVYQRWGFAPPGARSLGLTALFTGPSGTGKTTAAEVLAHELDLDLFCIDLSQVVSKFIGETEKNLSRIFDAAEQGGAILFFDEADALFGRRTEVRESHDRFANIEVSYLLQRMEAYRGLAVLATNMKNALDPAFLRRLRFVVPFPFPDETLRAQLWRRILPPQAPTEGLDLDKLARLSVAGGNIRNIAVNAAFLAAKAGAPIRMAQMLEAARLEYLKLEKPLTEREIKGWVA